MTWTVWWLPCSFRMIVRRQMWHQQMYKSIMLTKDNLQWNLTMPITLLRIVVPFVKEQFQELSAPSDGATHLTYTQVLNSVAQHMFVGLVSGVDSIQAEQHVSNNSDYMLQLATSSQQMPVIVIFHHDSAITRAPTLYVAECWDWCPQGNM